MSKRRLRRWLLGAVAFLSAYAVVYAVLKWCGITPWAQILESLIPIALGIPLATTANAFNRRSSYLQALRHLWDGLVPAAQEAIRYTRLSGPTERDFIGTQSTLSVAIDELRGVFENVPASGTRHGLYPYENLKDIQVAISWLGIGENYSPENARLVRMCVVRLWQEMHEAMLAEFDRDRPVRPVSKYLHWGKSLADLLKQGSLSSDDFELGRSASNPTRRSEPLLPVHQNEL